MTLKELKISSYIYCCFSKEDKSYLIHFSSPINNITSKNVVHIHKFLRSWGCRQLRIKNQKRCNNEIIKWYNFNRKELPLQTVSLINLNDEEIYRFEHLFNSLSKTFAANKINQKSQGYTKSTIGLVGAAKLLFFIRKDVFPPWDNPIINKLHNNYEIEKLKRSGKGYCEYMIFVRNQLQSLRSECKRRGLNFNRILNILEREKASLPKLIDEYLWISITRGVKPKELIKRSK